MNDLQTTEVKEGKTVVDIASNILVYCQVLLDDLDDLEEYPTVFRQQLKLSGKRFKEELEKSINVVHGNVGSSEGSNIVKIYDDYHKILWQLDKLTIQERFRLSKAMPELVEKLKLNKELEIKIKT